MLLAADVPEDRPSIYDVQNVATSEPEPFSVHDLKKFISCVTKSLDPTSVKIQSLFLSLGLDRQGTTWNNRMSNELHKEKLATGIRTQRSRLLPCADSNHATQQATESFHSFKSNCLDLNYVGINLDCFHHEVRVQ